MILQRSRNTKRNIIVGTVCKLISLFLPFLVKSLLVGKLGADYLGMNSLFASVLQVLNVSELGIGVAIVSTMYGPIVNNDTSTICALLKFYRRAYKIIGLVLLTVGIVCTPLIPKLVKGDCPQNVNVYIVYLLYLVNTVLSYWLFSYRNSLISAYQRLDINNIISMVVNSVVYILQIVILCQAKSYYVYYSTVIMGTIVSNVTTAVITKRLFPDIKCSGELDNETKKELKKKVLGLLVGKISGVTRNSFDSIFISMFIGLIAAGQYNNYYTIFVTVSSFIILITDSMQAGIGNSIASDSIDKNLSDMERLSFIYMLLAGWVSIFMLCLYQPVMELWMGRDLLLPNTTMCLFVVYFYICSMGNVCSGYSTAAGLFWENRIRCVLEGIGNIILNFFLVQCWGVTGIVTATIIPLLIFGFNGCVHVTYKHYFKQGEVKYLLSQTLYGIITGLIAIVLWTLCNILVFDGLIKTILYRFAVCTILAPICYWIVYHKSQNWKEAINWIRPRIFSRIERR